MLHLIFLAKSAQSEMEKPDSFYIAITPRSVNQKFDQCHLPFKSAKAKVKAKTSHFSKTRSITPHSCVQRVTHPNAEIILTFGLNQ